MKKMAKLAKTCQKHHPDKYCASRDVKHKVEYFNSGAFDYKCVHCGAKMLKSEYFGKASKCCHNGQVNLREHYEILQNAPQPLLDLCTNKKEYANLFMRNARRYNTEFAFASIHTVSEKAPPGGPQMCKINGESSFNLSDLYTKDGKRPAFGQYYVLEPQVAMDYRNNQPPEKKLNATILAILDSMIRDHNVLAQSYQFASELHKAKILEYMAQHQQAPKFEMTILTNREARELHVADGEVHAHRTDVPTTEQVAVVWISKSGEPPNFSGVRLHGRKGDFKEMPYFEPNVDPACFPLLFPYGTQGYHFGIDKNFKNPKFQNEMAIEIEAGKGDGDLYCDEDLEWVDDFDNAEDNGMDDMVKKHTGGKRDKVSAREFYRYLFQFREDNPTDYHWLWTKRTLAELFVIITCNKIERHEMDWVRNIQDQTNLRSALPGAFVQGIEKGLKKGETLGRIYLAPPVWTGSRAYMQQQYADAKAMARELGAPVWFLTFTGNPNWPEIKNALAPGQSYTSRPDIVCRVFYHKLKELIKDIAERHVLGKCLGYVYSVEFQKRGMPHIHMLIILEKDPGNKMPDFCDEFVCAEIPDLPDKEDISDEAAQARNLHHWVTKLNLHDHDEKSPCMVDGKCSKYFPRKVSAVTVLSEKDFPIYKRRAPPGPDESKQWVYGPAGAPVVFHEGYEREAQTELQSGNKKNMVLAFFDLCREDALAKTLTYDKLGKHFWFDRKERMWLLRKKGNPAKTIVRFGREH
uniref:Helitron helicase-like domain-containing protein n=1 Tax=Romanomermis culicivorax TaxID=13658 RepID=A0A915K862_ROMCU